MSDNIYCYPGTDVLKNKLGIKEQEELHEAERDLSLLRLRALLQTPIKGDYAFPNSTSGNKTNISSLLPSCCQYRIWFTFAFIR